MGRLYHQINKRVEDVERQRGEAAGGSQPPPANPPTRTRPAVSGTTPSRRSSRRARPK
jgi:hypothetical protein